MRIRLLSKADAGILHECRLSGLLESPEAFLSSYDDVKDIPISQVEMALADPDIRYLGAFDGERLVGFMRYVRFSRLSRRHVAEVRSVYVRRSHRRHGLARRLLDRLVAEAGAAGIESLVLSVLSTNLPARRLYQSAGFVVYGEEPKAIRKPGGYSGQLHLWRDLSAPPTAAGLSTPQAQAERR